MAKIDDGLEATWERFPEPQTTFDKQSYKREWIHAEPLQFYLYETESKRWTVIDRSLDLAAVGEYKTKRAAIGAFRRKYCKK